MDDAVPSNERGANRERKRDRSAFSRIQDFTECRITGWIRLDLAPFRRMFHPCLDRFRRPVVLRSSEVHCPRCRRLQRAVDGKGAAMTWRTAHLPVDIRTTVRWERRAIYWPTAFDRLSAPLFVTLIAIRELLRDLKNLIALPCDSFVTYSD